MAELTQKWHAARGRLTTELLPLPRRPMTLLLAALAASTELLHTAHYAWLVVGGNDEHRCRRTLAAQIDECRQPLGARHVQIQQHQVQLRLLRNSRLQESKARRLDDIRLENSSRSASASAARNNGWSSAMRILSASIV